MLRSVAQRVLAGEARALSAGAGLLGALQPLGGTAEASAAPPHWPCAARTPSPQEQPVAAGPRLFSAAASLCARAGAEGALAGPGGAGPGGAGPGAGMPTKEVLYKGRGIQVFRLLVRMKVFQLSGVAALAIPITTFLSQGEVSAMQAVIASALLLGSGVASTALWYYSRRYVGELALLRDAAGHPAAARFSVLDFWGNREDNDVPLPALVPPLQGVLPQVRAAMLREMLIPVDVEGDRQYYLSLRYGHILDKQRLLALLEGRIEEPAQQQQGEGAAQGEAGGTGLAAAGSRVE